MEGSPPWHRPSRRGSGSTGGSQLIIERDTSSSPSASPPKSPSLKRSISATSLTKAIRRGGGSLRGKKDKQRPQMAAILEAPTRSQSSDDVSESARKSGSRRGPSRSTLSSHRPAMGSPILRSGSGDKGVKFDAEESPNSSVIGSPAKPSEVVVNPLLIPTSGFNTTSRVVSPRNADSPSVIKRNDAIRRKNFRTTGLLHMQIQRLDRRRAHRQELRRALDQFDEHPTTNTVKGKEKEKESNEKERDMTPSHVSTKAEDVVAWQLLWFVLVDGILYYHSKEEGKLVGAIDLCLCAVEEVSDAAEVKDALVGLPASAQATTPFVFRAVASTHTYHFVADSDETRREWVHTMNYHIDMVRNSVINEEELLREQQQLQPHPSPRKHTMANPPDKLRKGSLILAFNLKTREALRGLYSDVLESDGGGGLGKDASGDISLALLRRPELDKQVAEKGDIGVFLSLVNEVEVELHAQLQEVRDLLAIVSTTGRISVDKRKLTPRSSNNQSGDLLGPQNRKISHSMPPVRTLTYPSPPPSNNGSRIERPTMPPPKPPDMLLPQPSNNTNILRAGYIDLRVTKGLAKFFGRKKWTAVYIVLLQEGFLKCYASRKAFESGLMEMSSIQLLLACVKGFDGQGNRIVGPKNAESVERETKKEEEHQRFCFEIITAERNYMFSVFSPNERDGWIKSINDFKRKMLDHMLKDTVRERRQSMMLSVQNGFSLEVQLQLKASSPDPRDLSRLEGNDLCADCRNPNPEWASQRFGVLVCIECSGVHRGLYIDNESTDIKVRSIELDYWDPAQILLMVEHGGNAKLNRTWEARLPASTVRPQNSEQRHEFIMAKYKQKAYCA